MRGFFLVGAFIIAFILAGMQGIISIIVFLFVLGAIGTMFDGSTNGNTDRDTHREIRQGCSTCGGMANNSGNICPSCGGGYMG